MGTATALTVAALGVDDPLVLPELVVGDVVEGVLGVRRPEHRRVVLEVTLDDALRGRAHLRFVIMRGVFIFGILHRHYAVRTLYS